MLLVAHLFARSVIAVASVKRDPMDELAADSNWGELVRLAAPGALYAAFSVHARCQLPD